ncbi:DMT family transporter [Carboxydochorda subterranea]|uniref:DMT family transporter n=1 Tax=Carboxydichorda subterranea TaxID=3109565 RepID=A0ABZ1C1P5_9FIRM|nr:DMT family transporter [Limnochorda sp. L945t]WRP18696.1 DMT family transporter [Limnochorda sp. L945t]
MGLASYGASLVLYVRALRELGTARTGAYFSLAPFVGAASVLWWREPVTAALAAAGALMGAGAWVHLSERHGHFHVHEPMEHAHAHVHDAHHRHEHRPEDPAGEPHTHVHRHAPVAHRHPHYPDIHHGERVARPGLASRGASAGANPRTAASDSTTVFTCASVAPPAPVPPHR